MRNVKPRSMSLLFFFPPLKGKVWTEALGAKARGRGAHVAACVAAFFLASTPLHAQTDGILVVTSLQATYSITTALAKDTSIRVENAPANGARMADHARIFADDDLDALFTDADAVVTIARVWREDPLYVEARARNIRVVPIEAARPWDEEIQPVGLRRTPCALPPWGAPEPCGDTYSPFIWSSIANGVRMAENIAADLERLSPADAETIAHNLTATVALYRALQADYDNRFASLADARVYALADEFVYLFDEMGIYVDGYFAKEDVRWTEADLAGFEAYLRASGPTVVVHKWEPNQQIKDAITRAGAKLVILDTLDPGLQADGRLNPEGYTTLLKHDYDTLLSALSGN